jgi:hypothetical protein
LSRATAARSARRAPPESTPAWLSHTVNYPTRYGIPRSMLPLPHVVSHTLTNPTRHSTVAARHPARHGSRRPPMADGIARAATDRAPLPHLHREWAHPVPHLHREWARPCPTSAPGLGLTPSHIGTGTRARPCNICNGTGLAPATSATRPGPPWGAPAWAKGTRCGRGSSSVGQPWLA